MANRYESELLRAGEAFAADFARKNPNHPDLEFMNAENAAIRARLNLLSAREQASTALVGSAEALSSRLEPRLFKIEIPTVSVADYTRTREAVEAKGAFIIPIRSVSLEGLLAEDLNRGQRLFNHNWVNSSKTMRATVPPEMEVFIDPKAVIIKGTQRLSTEGQKERIAEAVVSFRQQLPKEVRGFVDLHMVDPSTYSQLEDAWMDAGKGLLFPDYFARTDVQTLLGYVAIVGRRSPRDQREVCDWSRGDGDFNVFAVPVGVLPRKLTA